MKITIVGSGAIGGVIGAYLARAGENVTFVDIAEDHVEAMKKSGLTIETLDGNMNVPVKAMTVDEFVASGETMDVVFLAVKAQHTEQAVRQFMNRLHEKSVVVSMQNGLCEDIISSLIGSDRTIGCFVNLFADYMRPGVIQYGGVGSLYIGELDGSLTPRLSNIHKVLQHWGDAKITDNIWGYLWGKLAYGAILTSTALVDETMADIIEPKENREFFVELASETLSAADKLRLTPMGFDDWEPSQIYPVEKRDWNQIHRQMDRLVSRLRSYKKVKSGIWRDLAVRKRKTEVPFHLNPVIEAGEKEGLDMTLTRKVVEMIQDLEEGRREMSSNNLEQLKELYYIKKKK
jgi:2-dehydropantoate 2-reductase